MIPAKDISRYQGNWQDTGEPIVMIKCGGGDDGLYFDSQCTANYTAATKAGKAVGLYWFAGWTNPIAEAAFFVRGISPLAENDVYALDVEAIPANVDPVAWSEQFLQYVHDHTNGTWPLIYMNLSTLNAHNWNSVLAHSGLWLADWAVSPQATIPTSHVYVMQQYSDGPNYDHDEWFGTIEEFKAYGYHAPQTVQVPQPAPAPSPASAPEPVPAEPVNVEPPVVPTPPQTPPVSPPEETKPTEPQVPVIVPVNKPVVQPKVSFISKILALIKKILFTEIF